MTEIIVTSSALILALLVLRRLFRQKISRRVQYALWALVLARLLVPVSLPAAEFSVLSTAGPVLSELDGTALYIGPMQERAEAMEGDSGRRVTASPYRFAAMGPSSEDNIRTFTDENWVTHEISYARQINLEALLRPVWYAGMAVMACWLAVTNLRFWRKLRRTRIPLELEGRRVYLVEEGLISPCLFGLFRPAIYLTPAAMETEESLRHVIAHESTHARHLDPLWSLLRGVCLTIYWFNPLVWWAAAASRVDCELACDEGALRRLGEGERLAYGQTLLRLIPVQRAGGSPLLTATTMTADKKRLAERITRIAENRRTRKTALCAAAALAVLVCAVTFTGGSAGKRPLTAGELAWFNEYFFAGTSRDNAAQWFLHNQFLSPEQIDLHRLSYFDGGASDGISSAEEEALRLEGMEGPSETEELVKLSTASIEAVLRQYTGLGLEDMEGVGLTRGWQGLMSDLTYLPAYDAYYFTRDANNQPTREVMRAGEREGDLVRLYFTYWDVPYEWWNCVTLRDRGDNQYWFVSNQVCEEEIPAIPTVYPDTPGPVEVIQLDNILRPYTSPDAQPVRRLEAEEITERLSGGWALENYNAAVCLAADGNRYLVAYDDYQCIGATAYAQIPDDGGEVFVDIFPSLFGREGVVVTYQTWLDGGSYGVQCNDFYQVKEDGSLVPLLRAYGEIMPIDLDGDGDYELTASDGWRYAQIFYQRDDTLYCADLGELLPRFWPEAGYMEFGQWDRTRRCLSMWGGVVLPGHEDLSTGQATAFRDIYFNGEELLVYKSERAPALDLPAYVDEAASAIAQRRMAWWQKNTGVTGGDGAQVGEPAHWDAWRITQAEKVDSASYGDLPEGVEAEVYDFAFELHTTTPEKVVLAGGTYLDEDGWVGGFYNEDRYLVFWKNPDTGRFTRVASRISSDMDETSPAFRAGLAWTLVRCGAVELADLSAETLFSRLQDAPTSFLEDLAVFPYNERLSALEKLLTHPDAAAYVREMSGWNTDWSAAALETLNLLRSMVLG